MASKGEFNPAIPVKYDSLIILEVKPWEAGTDLSEVAKKLSEISKEGLAWIDTW
jgi:translation elongation factor EF-1beta